MGEKFVVKRLTERTVTMTLRLDAELNKSMENLSKLSRRSRNELINMAVRYALDNIEFIDDTTEPKDG